MYTHTYICCIYCMYRDACCSWAADAMPGIAPGAMPGNGCQISSYVSSTPKCKIQAVGSVPS